MRRARARIIPMMQCRAPRVAVAAIATVCAVWVSQPAAACPLTFGQKIVLVSQELDPDVFVWDSRDHLVSYAQGDASTTLVLKHTILVRAFTDAVVTSCKNVLLRMQGVSDESPPTFLVGVKVTGGEFRGRFGWVAPSDVRHADGSDLTSNGR